MAKTTIATVKAFARKNADNLFVKSLSDFDGMTDCVQSVKDDFKKVSIENAFGHSGVYLVGSSRDCINAYEDDKFVGYKVYNCCGSGIIATTK